MHLRGSQNLIRPILIYNTLLTKVAPTALPAAVRDVFSSLDLKLISQVLALFTVPCWSTSQKVMQTINLEQSAI